MISGKNAKRSNPASRDRIWLRVKFWLREFVVIRDEEKEKNGISLQFRLELFGVSKKLQVGLSDRALSCGLCIEFTYLGSHSVFKQSKNMANYGVTHMPDSVLPVNV